MNPRLSGAFCVCCALLFGVACSDAARTDPPADDAGASSGATDGGTPPEDGGTPDAGAAESIDVSDGGVHDAGAADSGLPDPTTTCSDLTVDILSGSPSAVAGVLHPIALRVRVTARATGAPVPQMPVEWMPHTGSGWTFPAGDRTDENGVAQAQWIAGSPGAQAIDVAIAPSGCAGTPPTNRISGSSVAATSRARSIYLWFDTSNGGRWDKVRASVTARTAPPATFYVAIQFGGGYVGIQPANVAGKQVLFSVWDVHGGPSAQLLDGASSSCGNFGGEGTGIQCFNGHPAAIDETYAFEVQAQYGASTIDYTAYMTPPGGSPIKLGTIRYGKLEANHSWGSFAEDYGPYSAHCIAAPERRVDLHGTMYESQGTWTTLKTAYFTKGGLETGRPDCSNVKIESGAGGFTMRTGGLAAGAPGVWDTWVSHP